LERRDNAIRDKKKTTFVIIDAQSVKNTDTAEEKGMIEEKKSLALNDTLL